jgi:D-alanyl-D-alanine carboxypeptidase
VTEVENALTARIDADQALKNRDIDNMKTAVRAVGIGAIVALLATIGPLSAHAASQPPWDGTTVVFNADLVSTAPAGKPAGT